jgi:hypothetical protein
MLKRSAVAAIAAVALLAPAGSASAAKYSGESEQSRPVDFKVKGGKVRGFVAGVNLFCIGRGIEFNAAIPPRPMKIKARGKFAYKGDDKQGQASIEITGKVKGKTASGKVSMTRSGCSGTAKWTARRK